MHHSTDKLIHNTVFVIAVIEHWLEQKIVQWIQTGGFDPMIQHTMSKCSTTELQIFQNKMTYFIFNFETKSRTNYIDGEKKKERKRETQREIDRKRRKRKRERVGREEEERRKRGGRGRGRD